MKEIDILNGIASGEIKPGFKIKSKNGDTYEFVEGKGRFVNTKDEMYVWSLGDFNKLNDEVEIIEEDKGIEKITWKEKESMAGTLTEKQQLEILKRRTEKLKKSFNELIDELRNELNKLKGKMKL